MLSTADRTLQVGMANSSDAFKGKGKGYENTQLKHLGAMTGGSYMSASSDMRKFTRNMVEDVTTYYEATYSGANEKRDGHFLLLSVKIDRPQVRVQSPAGYFSLPTGGRTDIEPFEVTLLKALAAHDRAETIWFDGTVVRFAQADGRGADLLVQVPLKGLLAREDDDSKLFRMHLSILALLKDAHENIVQKFGQDIGLTGAFEQLQLARKDAYTFERPFVISPGEYRVDFAIADQNANKVSMKTITFSIPSAQGGLAISDLIVVRRLEASADKLDAPGLLRYNGMRVVPDINAKGKRMGDPRHPVFFEVLLTPNRVKNRQLRLL